MKKILIPLIVCIVLIFSMPAMAQNAPEDDPCKECPYPLAGHNVFVQDQIGYYILNGAIVEDLKAFVEACMVYDRYQVKRIVIVLNSPGGDLFEGMAVAQKMIEEIKKGKTIKIRGYGLIASAASIILAVGSKGERYIAPNTILMIHELQVLEWGISFKGVSAKEKEAEVVRFLQDNMTDFLLPHIKLSKKELEEKCEDESWGDAQTAIKWGFADKIIK